MYKRQVGLDAMETIKVVPNPYYGYSSYEKNQLDNRVKITNLPSRATISIFTIGGTLVRIGNFFNSEIVGVLTNSDYGVVFLNRGEVLPRHPAQLYEAFGYIILFAVLMVIYNKTKLKDRKGFIFGFFLMFLFVVRFIVEYVKESQGGLEEQFGILSTGQWLSIPFIILGFYLMSRKSKII